MPSNQMPLGALPTRFRRERVLVVGCGDVGLRVARELHGRVRLLALTSSPERVPVLRQRGLLPLQGNLDDRHSIARLAGLATRLVHLAPPPGEARVATDPRTTTLLRALRLRTPPASIVYGSTTGVYGDCGGEKVSECRMVSPRTSRASRRVDAEQALRFFGRSAAVRASILRIPGIYAPDREGGTPRERLLKRTPVLRPQDDVYTNHIHADDLARAVVAALWRGRPQRVVNTVDDTEMKMGDWFDLAADVYGLARPPRVAREQAQGALPIAVLSFMGESRRLDNTRLKRELRLRLRYPTVDHGLRSG
ncbi:NAD-dependent epimerase/dehydratase family protein [Ramlibacter henchirensis]|uniref:NAD-dependent epimerase/dehydratase family protein n=1 Tax=Ramlibacter henchirensis TaxID=204072 RepID=A0A4Z0C104_9BURK|nr:NAD-dependent epimerase/dehydratase family protein [Ramlibacter henchirensis]TFZ05206.1 NAD-dependent epimerase/dehydratase family protein [Ramlibacter henchirensis]